MVRAAEWYPHIPSWSSFMIILHGKENKVYGGREMERKIDLSNFMYARLYDASKDMITNRILFLYSIH